MILKNNDDGFMGPYLRSRTMYYLRKEEFGAQSLEPIHQLLERATDDEIDHSGNLLIQSYTKYDFSVKSARRCPCLITVVK